MIQARFAKSASRTMLQSLIRWTPALLLAPVLGASQNQRMAGEALPSSALGPGVVETMEVVLERGRTREAARAKGVRRKRNGAPGEWIVPSRNATYHPHSGEHYATNRFGDTRMGIGFGQPVDLRGAWVAGQASAGAWASGLLAIGYRAGREVARSDWFEDIGRIPAWFAMDLEQVDRVVLVARPTLEGAGWYALDDLTFDRRTMKSDEEARTVIVDFDDLDWRARLSGSSYAGLSWETGSGDFEHKPRAIPAPIVPHKYRGEGPSSESTPSPGAGTLPDVVSEFFGMRMFENGTSAIPPDSCGAAGPEHFVSVVNVKLGVFEKATGTRVFEAPLADFFGVSALGDPRVVYDHQAQRWFVLCSSGPSTARIYLAISLSSDPTGAWFKSFVQTDVGTDAGRWPDYPTLGFDAHGFYMASLMVPSTMTIWAIDKAPLLAATPSLGTVTAWRDLQFEGAIQPCTTFGDSGGQLLVSRPNATQFWIRQIAGPLTAPTLSTIAVVTVPLNGNSVDAPALGSATDLSTGDARPMNAVYRDGSLYTAHTINVDGRAGCRWYELDVASGAAVQVGTISDSVRSYFFPSIAVNALGHVVLGFSGSHAGEYAGAYYTGRHALDPPNVTAPPALLRAGAGPYNHVDGNGVARWGDYSLTSVDPVDDSTFWTIQEYARVNNRWGTWIAEIAFVDPCPSTWNTCGTVPNSVGPGALMESSGGTSIAANDLTLRCSGAPPFQNGIFFYGPQETAVLFGDGVLCVTGGLLRFPTVTVDGLGAAAYGLDITDPPQASGQITAGSTWYFQFWYRDPAGGGSGFNLSDALAATFCP